MCAQFTIRTSLRTLANRYHIPLDEDAEWPESLDLKIVPYQSAPVIVEEGDRRRLKMMNFSLIPSWSTEPKVRFATHNARLETVDSKPTWRGPFQKKHCLVPMSSFIEPIYEHEFAGNMVDFSAKDQGLLTAAGIYDTWVNKKTGEVIESFAVITDDPPHFVLDIGHDRCPVFIQDTSFADWLAATPRPSQQLKQMLSERRESIDFQVKIDRPLKPGWEKRKPKPPA